MKIVIVGAGPAGLYCGLLLKKANPTHDVTVIERNARDVSSGWGLVFSEHTLGTLQTADAPSAGAIADQFVLADALDVRHRGETVRVGGQVFAGIGRRALLSILARRCEELGVALRFGTPVRDLADLAGADVIIAADGAHSVMRGSHAAAFGARVETSKTRHVWMGTSRGQSAYTLAFHDTEHGLFQAHTYPFDDATSAFIVECRDTAWQAAGLDQTDKRQTIDFCERLFAGELGGRGLLSNGTGWTSFRTLNCDHWSHENIALLGDAAHTAHFSIGSGARLAMEDAVALARALETRRDLQEAFDVYETERRPAVAAFQQAARVSQSHFENLARYLDMEPLQFTFHLLTRSGWATHETLRARSPQFVDAVNRWFARAASDRMPAHGVTPPPMLVPFRLRNVDLANRMVFRGGRVDATRDGRPTAAAARRYAALARVGAAMVMTEPVAVAPGARPRPESPGLYDDAHVSGWITVAASVHAHTRTRLAVVLTHVAHPRPAPRWAGAARSRILEAFAQAARRAHAVGADVLLLDVGPGTLLSQAFSGDEGSGEAPSDDRFRVLVDVVTAARGAWPAEKPVGICLAPQGPSDAPHADAAVAASRACRAQGLDVVHVELRPDDQGGFAERRQHVVALADRIRHEVDIPVIASCAALTIDEVNSLLAAGRADLCVINVGSPPTS